MMLDFTVILQYLKPFNSGENSSGLFKMLSTKCVYKTNILNKYEKTGFGWYDIKLDQTKTNPV